MHRRQFVQTGVLASLVLLLDPGQALTGPLGRDRSEWFGPIDELCAALRGQALTDAEWREGLDQMFARVELDDLLTAIDYERLRSEIGFASKGVTTARIDTGGRRLSFFPKMFAADRGRAIIPHGHAGMVSAHFVVSGRMRLRQFDQVERTATLMLVRPTRDEIVTPGGSLRSGWPRRTFTGLSPRNRPIRSTSSSSGSKRRARRSISSTWIWTK